MVNVLVVKEEGDNLEKENAGSSDIKVEVHLVGLVLYDGLVLISEEEEDLSFRKNCE